MVSVAYYLLAISLSGHCRLSISDLERIKKQSEALECSEMAGKLTGMNDTRIVYSLSLENAEQRKLDAALGYAKHLAKMEGGSSLKRWILLARILSGQKRFSEGETVINAALEQTGKWDQGELLKTKARLQVAQGLLYEAKGLEKEAQNAYELALDLDPTYVRSLVSMAVIIRRAGGKSAASAKSFLTKVLRLDRLNSSAWYNLGLFYKEDGPMFLREAANCFEAASILEETEPIETFR
ncbi:tetratricopeptide-like helical domain-containing protein [Artemisia annua]|uniref:Tetratricopeptide-like helical domain-containing protein n=1 Tax=Artemisia annua TaxID=35608 RepID=A0A2U1PUL1_ARTAN|nr:tetratricopeptide-like helical domain-containing protein [Artemisia annua]